MTIALLEAPVFGLERLAAAAAGAGHRLCLLTGDRAVYRHELSRADPERVEVVDVDTTDVDACAAALARQGAVAGLVNATDTWALPGAELARRLGLPGARIETVRTLRDKGQVRAALHRAGLSGARATAVEPGTDTVQRLAALHGYPLMLKDSAGTSSRNVWLARDRDELRRALAAAARAPLRGHLLAEPYWSGPLYSAETVTWGGETRLLGFSSRVLSPEPMRREEGAAFPVAFPDADRAALGGWVARVLAAVGIDQGFGHTEFVLTAGGPEVVEINGRIAGAVIGEAMCRALGTNVHAALVAMALGGRPGLLDGAPEPRLGAALVRLYAPHPGTLAGWSGLDRLGTLPGDVAWFPTARPGDRVEHLGDQRGCTGIVLAEGPTAELALHRALTAAGTVAPTMT